MNGARATRYGAFDSKGTLGIRKSECLQIKKHVTGEPTSYSEWFDWAEKKAKTHRQERCPTCGFYSIWEPKRKASRVA